MASFRKSKRWLQALFLLFLVVASVWIILDARRPAPYRAYEGRIFGTTFHITYESRNNLEVGIMQRLHEVDASLSMFNERSTISLINTGRSNATDALFREVFVKAEDVARRTGGAFDITVAPLVNAWGFGFKNKEHISDALLDSLMQLVGYEKVTLHDDRIQKSVDGLMLDCSGIAKGYGCDRVARFLTEKGVENFMIEIGGEIVARGRNAKGNRWTVGIIRPQEDPTAGSGELQSVATLTDMALATSGNYRNFYYEGGQKYAHTIDPHSGRPVQHSLLSATVIAPTCAEADAFATAFMVMGMDDARAVLQRETQLMAYFIYAGEDGTYQTWYTPSFAALIQE